MVDVPLNEHSHIHMEVDPTSSSSAFRISYHLYEDYRREYKQINPSSPANIRDDIDWRDWEGDISLDGLGTAYATDGDDDEAARKLAKGWEVLTEDGGLLSWSNIKTLMKDGIDDDPPKLQRKSVQQSLYELEHEEMRSPRHRITNISAIATSGAVDW